MPYLCVTRSHSDSAFAASSAVSFSTIFADFDRHAIGVAVEGRLISSASHNHWPAVEKLK